MTSNKELTLYFLLAFFCAITAPVLFPSIKLFYFIPFIVRSFYLKSKEQCLFLSLLAALTIDLLSASDRFGLISCNYVICSFLLYNLKNQFFEDYFTTLPAVTFIYSLTSTIIQTLLLLSFDQKLPSLTSHFLLKDALLMPLLDALYAAIFFGIPSLLFKKPSRRGTDYFAN